MTDPAADWRAGGFGVYIHWPFCAAKCPYCDFNSHVRAGVDQKAWRRALVSEVAAAAEMLGRRRVGSIFFGGGTPSLMPPETVGAVIDSIAEGFDLDAEAEITLEANPTSVEAARFHGYRSAGVNRISMGIQALRDPDLRALGRMHSVAEARSAFDLARGIFPRASFDLIYARQGQTQDAWRQELAEALAMAADHLSLYQLTIEPGTRFGDLAARGRLRGLPDGDLAADLYQLTQELCSAAGMPAYEVSNHACLGAEGRHNLVYWRCGDYLGIGPGAHGRLTVGGERWAVEAPVSPEAWLDATTHGDRSGISWSALRGSERAMELLLMGLRLDEGVSLDRYRSLAGVPLDSEALRELTSLGLVETDDSRIRATGPGRMLLDSVLSALAGQPVSA